MKMKRFVAAAIAAVSCLSFAACGSDTASKDENVIHIMSSGDSSANMERALVDEYNKTADVKAVLDLVTSADYQNKLQTVMSNPKSDSAPDIFFNWADALMIQYARADVSAPLDEYMEKDPELKDNFLPSILDAAKVDGKYYGIPVRGVQPIVLFYNKKVLSDNGIEAPTTFDEFCDACEKLKSAGLTPIALGGGICVAMTCAGSVPSVSRIWWGPRRDRSPSQAPPLPYGRVVRGNQSTASIACLRSAMMSSAFSMPQLRRTRSMPTPASTSCSSVS